MSNILFSGLSKDQLIQKSKEYPIESFPDLVKKAIIKSAFYHDVPIAVAGQTYLAQMSYIAQQYINAPSDKKESGQPASLAILTIFPSGEGKDVCKDDAGYAAVQNEKKKMQEFIYESSSYINESKKERGERPKNPQSIFVRATTQGILKHMSMSDTRGFIWSTGEAGYLLGGYSLQAETRSDALSTLTDLVDKGSVSSNLSGDNCTNIITDKRFCLDLSVQDVVARPTLENEICRNQGFFARFLFAAPMPKPFKEITKESRRIKSYDDEDIKNYWQLCHKLFDPINLALDANKFSVILKNEEAEDLHLRFENHINYHCQPNEIYHSIQANAKRTKQYILRVAAILAFFSNKDYIDAGIMRGAINLCLFSLYQWLSYYSGGHKNDSEIVLKWLLEQHSNGNQLILKSSINQNIGRVKTAQLRDAALKYLIDDEYVYIQKVGKKEYICLASKALETI